VIAMKPCNAMPVAALVLMGLFILTIGIHINYTFIDEVEVADPVINFLSGNSYTTTAWAVTNRSITHVSTAPLYSLSLLLWLKIFGISQTMVRTLSAFFALCGALVFWRACLRSGLITNGAAGVVVICILLMDYGYVFSYTCGRPESLTALLIAAMFYFFTLQNKRTAVCAMCAIAFFLPFVQWASIVYLFFLSIALLILLNKKVAPYIAAVFACIAVGLLIQKWLYTYFGIWDTWVSTISVERLESITQHITSRMTLNTLLHGHSNSIPKDFSAFVIMVGMAAIYIRDKFFRRGEGLQFAKSSWILVAIVSLGMYFVGKFPTYYSWMVSFPLAAMLGAHFDKTVSEGGVETKVATSIAVLACSVGLPLQAVLASYDWHDRNPAAMSAELGKIISKRDVVYCDYPFYYIVKERAGLTFVGNYFDRMTQEELDSVTLVVAAKGGSAWKESKQALKDESVIWDWTPARSGILGNNWKYGILSTPNYAGTVYKLKEPVTAPWRW